MTTLPAPSTRLPRPIGASPLSIPQRLGALLCLLACASIVGLGAWMTPSPRGHGTHVQLGLPPCGWKFSTGYPCATCGMTTAVTHAAHGNLWTSIKTQPFGFLVALGAAAGFWVSLHGVLTGSRVDRVLWWFLRPKPLILVGILFFSAWGYKFWADASGVV